MDIETKDGYKIIPGKAGNALVIESNRIEDYMNYALINGITKISIYGYHGYKLSDLEFLKKYNFFTEISVVEDLNNINISAVHSLHKLKCITLTNGKQSVNFSCFPQLEEASIDWNDNLRNLIACKSLKKLVLWKYKPKSKTFFELDGLRGLESLEITESNIESFSGIEKLKCLNYFEGTYLPKLKSLEGIESLSKNLTTLILNTCKNLDHYGNILRKLKNLEKLVLSKCGELNDLNFIISMHKLKFFSFVNTNIKDGNLSFLMEKNFEYVGFDDKRHYSHKMKEITPSFSWYSKSNQK